MLIGKNVYKLIIPFKHIHKMTSKKLKENTKW